MIHRSCLFAKLCTVLVLLLVFSNAYTDDYIKNDMPCFSGVCVGDDIVNLKNITWEPAISDMGRPLSSITPDILGNDRMDKVSKIFPPQIDQMALASIAPYIYLRKLDTKGIELISKIKIFCEQTNGLRASFKSESGNYTSVTLDVIPNKNSTQSIRVTHIVRNFSRDMLERELDEILETLTKRYANIEYKFSELPDKATWSFNSATGHLVFRAPSGDRAYNLKLFRGFPGCSQSTSLLD